jgi:hypothetical protein
MHKGCTENAKIGTELSWRSMRCLSSTFRIERGAKATSGLVLKDGDFEIYGR